MNLNHRIEKRLINDDERRVVLEGGRKMYDSNPDWLANRVEVGGLFWHFVDLVWIFLFPILYLM